MIIQDIATARTSDSKPQFSNESVRAAELALRMRNDGEAACLKEQIERSEMLRQRHLAQLERLRGELKLALVERQAGIAALAPLAIA
jgi:hypothetical protein